jgi:uncharacterized integral membrane protein
MQFFYWLILLVVVCLAIFGVQNSNAPVTTIKFLLWKFETSLVYTVLGSVGAGILVTFFFWIPKTVKSSIRSRELKKKVESLEKMLYGPSPSMDKTDTNKQS